MASIRYCPDPAASNPFSARPSEGSWGKEHLEWLHVDFTSGCQAVSTDGKDGLIDDEFIFSHDSAVFKLVHGKLGLPWPEIGRRSPLPYFRLFKLGKPKPEKADEIEALAPSSPKSSSQTSSFEAGADMEDDDMSDEQRLVRLPSSPPSATRLVETQRSESVEDPGTPTKASASQVTPSQVTPARVMPISSPPGTVIKAPVTPDTRASRDWVEQSGKSEQGPGNEGSGQSHRRSPSSNASDKTMATRSTDERAEPPSTPRRQLFTMEETPKANVVHAAHDCIHILQGAFDGVRDQAHYLVDTDHEVPNNFRTNAEGYLCSVTPDSQITFTPEPPIAFAPGWDVDRSIKLLGEVMFIDCTAINGILTRLKFLSVQAS